MSRQSPYRQALGKLKAQIRRAQNAFETTHSLGERGQLADSYESAFLLAAECERMALLARSLPQHTGHSDATAQMQKTLAATIPIQMSFATDTHWFMMSIPALLPKKERGASEYIRGLLAPAMQQFFAALPYFHYPDCVVIFRHIYDRRRPERQYRDHDNIELNAVVDMLAMYLLDGDMPLRCFHFYCSTAGDADGTEVTVLPQADFAYWLAVEKISIQGALDTDEL